MTIRPDPTFHATAKLAMEAPAEQYAYMPHVEPRFLTAGWPGGRRRQSEILALQQDRSHRDDAEQGRRISPLRLECLLVGAVAAERPRVPGAPLPDHPGHPVLAHLRGRHQSAARQRRRCTRSSSRRRCSARPAIPGPTRSIAGRKASMSPHSAAAGRTGQTARQESSSWTARHSMCSAAGRWTADRRTSTTISGGTCRATTWYRANGHCRRSSRRASFQRICCRNKYGHRLHFWDLRARRNVQTIDLGANHQMALEVRPAHDPIKEYGFVGVVVDTTNLEGSIWTWWREGGKFHCKKTATIPPEPAEKDQLPPLLQGFGAVPPLITDIDLSLDDRFLYVSCWGTGEMRQYDVSDPHASPSLPDRCISAASRDEPPTQTARHSAAGRRWSRSAATASGSTGPIRSIRPGTTSSIRTVCLARWSRPTLAPTAESDAGQEVLGRVPRGIQVASDPA